MATVAGSWAQLLNTLVTGGDLKTRDTAWAMDQIMTGEASPERIVAFVVALRAKGETSAEIRGMADSMLEHARPLNTTSSAVDIVGTGGDRSGSVNISTMAAIVASATGAPVVKHGNRAASSSCGTADVLEELGIAIDLSPVDVRRCVEEVGIGFCFAPVFHPAFKYTAAPRREIGIPTAFNVLGPLTNPARPGSGLIGCADPRLAPVLAEVFAARGNSILLVRGDDGMDEITTTSPSTLWVVRDSTVEQIRLDPTEFDVPLVNAQQLQGGDRTINARAVQELLTGQRGPVRDAVLLNAAAAVVAFEGIGHNPLNDLHEGVERVARTVDSGAAAELLNRWAAMSSALDRARRAR